MIGEYSAALEIKERNQRQLHRAFDECQDSLSSLLDQVEAYREEYVTSQPFEIQDAHGSLLKCRMHVECLQRNKDIYLRVSLCPTDVPTPHFDVHEIISAQLKQYESAMRFWNFHKSLKPDETDLIVKGGIMVDPQLREAGIGQALLQRGEYLKNVVAQKIGLQIGASDLITQISDFSPTGWTKRQIKNPLLGLNVAEGKGTKKEPLWRLALKPTSRN